jgi:hypothetical protein
MEGKIEEERRKKERRRRRRIVRPKAHVTVLRTCSMSLGGYM